MGIDSMTNNRPGCADIVISVKSEHMNNIVSRLKTHEFRKFLIPEFTKRMWFYVMAPIQQLQYIAIISDEKHPGEIDEVDRGIGNEEFNANKMEAKYAHEILHLYELKEPLSFYELKEFEFLRAPPPSAKWQWAKPEMLGYIKWNKQKKLF